MNARVAIAGIALIVGVSVLLYGLSTDDTEHVPTSADVERDETEPALIAGETAPPRERDTSPTLSSLSLIHI